MGLRLWKKPHILRRFKNPESTGGYDFEEVEDIVIDADIQTTDRSTTTGPDGDASVQRLKMFSDFEVNVADEQKGVRGDLIWFQGKWHECRSSRLSENTFLKHWTSTFVECFNQDDPPDEEGLLG